MNPIVLPLRTQTNAFDETIQLAESFAAQLEPNAIVLLEGSMGAGKTAFVRGLCSGLGMKSLFEVDSPTYTIANRYALEKGWLDHLDLFRLHHADALEQIDFEGILAAGSVLAIEWPDRIGDLPEERPLYLVHLEALSETSRIVTLSKLRAGSPI